MCFSTSLLPSLPLVSPKFPHVPPGVDGCPLGYEEEGVGLFVRALTVSNISNLCGNDPPTSQTAGQTDRRHMQSQYRALHYTASRGNKMQQFFPAGALLRSDRVREHDAPRNPTPIVRWEGIHLPYIPPIPFPLTPTASRPDPP